MVFSVKFDISGAVESVENELLFNCIISAIETGFTSSYHSTHKSHINILLQFLQITPHKLQKICRIGSLINIH